MKQSHDHQPEQKTPPLEATTTHNYDQLLQSLVDPLVAPPSDSSRSIVMGAPTTSQHLSSELQMSSVMSRDVAKDGADNDPKSPDEDGEQHHVNGMSLLELLQAVINDLSSPSSSDNGHNLLADSMEVSFIQHLDDNLRSIESFYKEQERSMEQRVRELERLQDLIGYSRTEDPRAIGRHHHDSPYRVLQQQSKRLYRALLLLQNYRILNYIGIFKILKKHDKFSSLPLSSPVKYILDQSYFFSSSVLPRCISTVLRLYRQSFFPVRDVEQAKAELQPKPLAWFTEDLTAKQLKILKVAVWVCGVALALLLVQFILISCLSDWSSASMSSGSVALSIYRVIGMLLIHCSLWQLCVHFLNKYRINYVFILALEPDSHNASYRRQIVCLLALLIIYLFSANLYLILCQLYNYSYDIAILMYCVHLFMFLSVIVMWFHPFNDGLRRTRAYFYGVCWKIVRLPFTSISFEDTFIANQGTSLMYCMPDFAYSISFYIYTLVYIDTVNDPSRAATYCSMFQFNYISWWLVALPNYWRFLQCIKRYLAGAGSRNLGNAFKYGNRVVLAIFDGLYGHASVLLSQEGTNATFVIWVVLVVLNVTYSFYWDVVQDWGLLRSSYYSKHPFLRNQIMIPDPKVYYVCMLLNLFFRVVSVFTVSPNIFFGAGVSSSITATILYELESIRRSLWNFFRLENEHFNNVCKFRAVDIIPLSLPTRQEQLDL